MYEIKLSTNSGGAEQMHSCFHYYFIRLELSDQCATTNHVYMVIKHNGVAGANDSGTEFKHRAYVRQLSGQTQYRYTYILI